MADLEADYLAVVLRDVKRDSVRKGSGEKDRGSAIGQAADRITSPKGKEREPQGTLASVAERNRPCSWEGGNAIGLATVDENRLEEQRYQDEPSGFLSDSEQTDAALLVRSPTDEASPSTHAERTSSGRYVMSKERRSRLGLYASPKPPEPQRASQEVPKRPPFRPRRVFPVDTLLHEYYRYSAALLEAGKFEEATRRPAGVHNTGEWLKINAFLYYNKANEFLGLLRERCTCDKMSIGSKYEYMWADGKTIRKPINIPALDYAEYVMEWVEANFDDTKLFPLYDDARSGHGFTTVVKDIFKRLFRVFGHMESMHREDLEAQEPGSAAELESTFRCFVEFVKAFKLMDRKGLAPIRKLQDKWKGIQK